MITFLTRISTKMTKIQSLTHHQMIFPFRWLTVETKRMESLKRLKETLLINKDEWEAKITGFSSHQQCLKVLNLLEIETKMQIIVLLIRTILVLINFIPVKNLKHSQPQYGSKFHQGLKQHKKQKKLQHNL